MFHLMQNEIVRWLLLGLALWTCAGIAVAAWLFAAHRNLPADIAPIPD